MWFSQITDLNLKCWSRLWVCFPMPHKNHQTLYQHVSWLNICGCFSIYLWGWDHSGEDGGDGWGRGGWTCFLSRKKIKTHENWILTCNICAFIFTHWFNVLKSDDKNVKCCCVFCSQKIDINIHKTVETKDGQLF